MKKLSLDLWHGLLFGIDKPKSDRSVLLELYSIGLIERKELIGKGYMGKYMAITDKGNEVLSLLNHYTPGQGYINMDIDDGYSFALIGEELRNWLSHSIVYCKTATTMYSVGQRDMLPQFPVGYYIPFPMTKLSPAQIASLAVPPILTSANNLGDWILEMV